MWQKAFNKLSVSLTKHLTNIWRNIWQTFDKHLKKTFDKHLKKNIWKICNKKHLTKAFNKLTVSDNMSVMTISRCEHCNNDVVVMIDLSFSLIEKDCLYYRCSVGWWWWAARQICWTKVDCVGWVIDRLLAECFAVPPPPVFACWCPSVFAYTSIDLNCANCGCICLCICLNCANCHDYEWIWSY